MIGSEQVISSRQPLVEILLHDSDWDLSRTQYPGQAGMTGKHVEVLFLEHCRYALGQRRKCGVAEHGQLLFAAPVDKFSVGKKIQPVVHRRIERAKQSVATKCPSLQELSRFQLSRITKIIN